MTQVVYLDTVVLGNLVMNYAILWATAKFAQFYPSRWRLLCGAAVGSIYALTVFIPPLQWMLIWCFKLLLSLLMVLAAFGFLPWRRLLITLAYFYLASFAIGGAVFAALFFLQSSGYYGKLKDITTALESNFWWAIAFALVLTAATGWWGAALYRKSLHQKSYKRMVTIDMLGRQVQISALIDSGNALYDPLTGLPVTVVEYGAIKGLLPAAIQELYEQKGTVDYQQWQRVLSGSPWAGRFKLIPYRSLGKSQGMLWGFTPDKIQIDNGSQTISTSKVIVAVHRGVLTADNGYRALLHPQLIKAA
ncbi:sigma-E processing peptidase SpoIIGA [Desulfofalx alkaliphila]|uniref:sigma-E processing peptidase SpoIIGA n=1 Tax=Desulfofalx alkaliphila TaxID=105483 RepID=UPI0004E2235B|nr:sigma-E processing peptidase SpoIIGA [Desulfofalx alkaliphila]